jgi:YesN/AraC family two-component response regulator
MAIHILFVDDEPSLRATLPAILQQHGYEVTAVATVAEAIQRIGTQNFEVLIADLNVGEPGDGFTIVSAMKRTQSNCVNIILTGYPAFENALRAIQAQVDDFLVKPADIGELVDVIERKIAQPDRFQHRRHQRVAECLRENTDEIIRRAMKRMKDHPRLAKLRVSDEDRTDHIKAVLAEIYRELERGPQPQRQTKEGRKHGRTRKQQGYSLPMLVDDRRAIDSAINSVIKEKLLDLDLSCLLDDLERLNDSLDTELQHAIEGFTGELAA